MRGVVADKLFPGICEQLPLFKHKAVVLFCIFALKNDRNTFK